MQKSFQFIVNDKAFIIPLFDKLMNISSNIREELIFSQQHQYHVQSKIRTEVFEDFIKYLTTNEIPNLSISNINEYDDLSSEFETLLDEVEEKKNELGEFLINIKGLQREIREDKSQFEESIAIKLDEYIEKYGAELMKSSICSLFNIFNHPRRKLSKYDEVYEIIKNHFEQTNDLSVFILLDTLDGTKMTRNNIEESYALSSKRGGHMPKIELSYFSNVLNQQEKQKEKIIELEKKEIERAKEIENLSKQQIELLKKVDELTKIIEKNHEIYEEKIKKYEEEQSKLYKIISQQEEIIKKIENSTEIEEKINCLEAQIKNLISLNKYNNCESFSVLLDKKSPGIISRLKNIEKSPFNRLFIASQSTNDIYNIINPKTNDYFEITNIGKYIEFEFEKSITITGIVIFSSGFNFPQSFDIEIDGQKIKSIINSNELNEKNKNMTINIDPILCRRVRLINTGPNWDRNSNQIIIKRIELLSNEEQYSSGVFSTLVNKSENHDPHKCPVFISSSDFDFNAFYLINPKTNICTFRENKSWFQIEFLFGAVILDGFRLKRCDPGKMKSYKIICTDDANKSIDEWIILSEIDEESNDEHQIFDTYKFQQLSPPVKFVRIVLNGQNWSDNFLLEFYHFDLFGKFIK